MQILHFERRISKIYFKGKTMVWSSVYSVVCGIQGYVNKFIRVMWVQTWSNVCVYTHRDTHPYTVYVHIYIYYSHTQICIYWL